MAQLESIQAIDEQEKSKKVEGLWQQLLAAREEAATLEKPLSPADVKTGNLKELIPSNLPNLREKSFQNAISEKPKTESTFTKISLPTQDTDKDPASEEKKISDETHAEKAQKKGRLNQHYANIKLASSIDQLYSSRILGKGKDLNKMLDQQKDLLKLKTMLPKDLSGKKAELSSEAKAKVEEINKKYGLSLDQNDVISLRSQIESILDSLKLEVQHGFTDIQTLNHERLLIFNLAQRQRDEKETFVRNQIPH